LSTATPIGLSKVAEVPLAFILPATPEPAIVVTSLPASAVKVNQLGFTRAVIVTSSLSISLPVLEYEYISPSLTIVTSVEVNTGAELNMSIFIGCACEFVNPSSPSTTIYISYEVSLARPVILKL